MIAEELEADPDQIKQICAAVEHCGLNVDLEKIYDVYEKISKE